MQPKHARLFNKTNLRFHIPYIIQVDYIYLAKPTATPANRWILSVKTNTNSLLQQKTANII